MAVTKLLGQDAAQRIAPAAVQFMRDAIAEAGGNEVFFAGELDTEGRVANTRVCARGHDGAVPATFQGLERRCVVIHNHPGGDLTPSEADLDLGVIYSTNGHGVYIVDNNVTRVYAVVEPLRDKPRHRVDSAVLAKGLGPAGALAQRLPGYEVRPQQTDMMEAVVDAFNEDGVAVIEAPTGVGKTMAYLLPAVQWALRNGERVVISTRTINLQEQIVEKDVPLLQHCFKEKFAAVLVKGRQNYVCPRRLERALSEATLFDEADVQETLKAIAEWAAKTEDGSTSDLPFVPPRTVWERVCSEADTCTNQQCQQAGNCFVTKARREIAKADLLVVNHHMLFSDLAIKHELGSFNSLAVLPAFSRVIIDEAHHVEDSATEYFGSDATRNGAMALLGRIYRVDHGRERGLLPFIKLKVGQVTGRVKLETITYILDLIDKSVTPAVAECRAGIEAAFQVLRSLTADKSGQIGREIKWRLTDEVLALPELRELHAVYVLPAAEELGRLARHCTDLFVELKRIPPAPDSPEHPLAMELAQLQAYRDRVLRLARSIAEGTKRELDENTVRWIEIDSNNVNIVRIAKRPLEVSAPLSEWVYPNLRTVVMCSATLTVGNKFNFLYRRIGLDHLGDREPAPMQLPSAFDFQEQALLALPDDLPQPDDRSFPDAAVPCIREALEITGGHAFILCTSFFLLNHLHRALAPELQRRGIIALKQGEASRNYLLDRFKQDLSSVLFATDSFWEGVDVPGEGLQCVIIPRLPFRVPTEPVLQARAEAIEAAGGNAFMEYTVPLAVIKFRQGFGRLIRRRSDRGSILVLDKRVTTKQYGKLFLSSLPDARVVRGPQRGVLAALRSFHQAEDSDA